MEDVELHNSARFTNRVLVKMLFSARPKETRSELFDREEELKELEACTKHPIVLITDQDGSARLQCLRCT